MRTATAHLGDFRATLRQLYFGRTRQALVFQSLMLSLDLLTLAYFLVTTFIHGASWIRVVDVVLGLVLVIEFGGRLLATKHPMEYLESTVAIVDMLVIASPPRFVPDRQRCFPAPSPRAQAAALLSRPCAASAPAAVFAPQQ